MIESKEFDKLAFEIGKQIHRHTIQLLVKGGEYGYKPHGSGVLIFTNSKCMIVTASHVTENIVDESLFVNSNQGIIPVIGALRETDLGKDKNTDLAYIILDDSLASILVQSYEFLPIKKIGKEHQPVRVNQYLVVGYPETNIRSDKKKRKIYSGSSIFLLTPSKVKVYEHYKFDVNKDYILDFAGKGINLETDEKSGKIEDPYGISGCGLWLLTEKQGTDTFELDYFLIGIMTELKKGKHHCLIGNRIDLIIEALVQLENFRF